MNEQTSNPTSGQNVPKSKFRRKSQQEQTTASKLRMERRGEKLDAAREKLAKQKPPKKPGAVKRLAHTAGHGVHGFVHGKLYEVEHENVGTEGAHRSELAAESVYRFGRRKFRKAIREHPAKAVECACADKCAVGAINTDCTVCAVNMGECQGKAPEPVPVVEPEPDPEPEQPKNSGGTILLVLAVAVIGGVAGWYFKIYRPKKQQATDAAEDYGDDYNDTPPWEDEDETESEDEA